jgi:hypothetical protein
MKHCKQHCSTPLVSSDLKTVCNLLQTCKSWRVALQHCAAGNLHLSIGESWRQLKQIQSIALLCEWLRQHGGLVSGIEYRAPSAVEERGAYFDIVEQLLVSSLQEPAAAAAAAKAAAGAGAAAAASAAAPAALQLRSFSTDMIRSPALLRALPAATLTRLDLQHSICWRNDLNLNSSSIAAGLAQLGGLRSLSLYGSAGPACIAAVGQLAQLTHLDLDCVEHQGAGSCSLQLLPPQLQDLIVAVNLASDIEDSTAEVALAHITALRNLDLDLYFSAAAGSSVPTSLTALTLSLQRETDAADSLQHLGVLHLQQLQKLHLKSSLGEPELLTTLTALTMLELSYDNINYAARAAPFWQRLSALHTLDLESTHGRLGPAESLALLQSLAAATSVKELSTRGIAHESVQLCAHLAKLTQLQALTLARVGARRADLLQLTALTNLTKLHLYPVNALGDIAASALVLSLKGLQELEITNCSLRSAAAVPSIATLTALTSLELIDHGSGPEQHRSLPAGREDLQLLLPLTRLKELVNSGFFKAEAVSELWDEDRGEWRHQQP